MQLETLSILPQGISQAIDGLPASEVTTWLTVAVGIYFVFHMPKFKSRLDKLNYQMALTKAEIELKELQNKLNNNTKEELKDATK